MKKCAEDAVKNGGVGSMEDSWWLHSGGSGRGAKGGSRSPRMELGAGFEHMDSTSIQMLADLVASAPVTGGDGGSDSPYSLHREDSQYSLHREHRRASGGGGGGGGGAAGEHGHGKYGSASVSSQSSNGNLFMADSGGSARRGGGGGGGSSSSECSSRSSGGGVSLSGMSAPRKEAHHVTGHVHREWREIIGDGAHGQGRGGAGDDGKRDGGGLQSSSNEESGPTDGSSTHGNGTSNGSGNDSGSSNRSMRSSNHSSGAAPPRIAPSRGMSLCLSSVSCVTAYRRPPPSQACGLCVAAA